MKKILFYIFALLFCINGSFGQSPTNVVTPKLPKTIEDNPDDFAVIIGCKNYKYTDKVIYALNDAQSMLAFYRNCLNIPESNILYIEDATLDKFNQAFGTIDNHKGWLYNNIKHKESRVHIYISGHGVPDINENSLVKTGYLFPVNGHPDRISTTAYSLSLLQKNLKELPAKEITLLIDACFSGEKIIKEGSPIGILPKQWDGIKNAIIFSACSNSQIASWYQEKKHGLFTYFFLEALIKGNTNNDAFLTYEEIFNYIANEQDGVPHFARSLKNREQTPQIIGNFKNRTFLQYELKIKDKKTNKVEPKRKN